MPPKNQPSPFEIVSPAKTKKSGNRGVIIAILIVFFLILSVVAGVLLVQQQQQLAQQAASPAPNLCPGAEACPYPQQPYLLRNCHPADQDGTPQEVLCNTAGKISVCGVNQTQYCCPAPGSAWTLDLTSCNQAHTPSPSPTPVPTPSPTVRASLTPTPTPAPGECNDTCVSDGSCSSGLICSGGFCRNPLCTTQLSCSCTTPSPATSSTPLPTGTLGGTPRPIPVTGIDWPTMAAMGAGLSAIIFSLFLAF